MNNPARFVIFFTTTDSPRPQLLLRDERDVAFLGTWDEVYAHAKQLSDPDIQHHISYALWERNEFVWMPSAVVLTILGSGDHHAT